MSMKKTLKQVFAEEQCVLGTGSLRLRVGHGGGALRL